MGERDHLIGLRGQSPGYAEDYAAWLAHQVALLQSGRFDALDIPNLVDEVESLGRSDFKALVRAIEIVLIHMLKWDHQPKRRTRSWELSIAEHRRRIARELSDSPSYHHRLAEAYLNDAKRLLPCAAYVEGQYGVDGLYVGVPVIIGAGGVEEIVEVKLDDEAKANLQVSVDAVKELLVACRGIDDTLN